MKKIISAALLGLMGSSLPAHALVQAPSNAPSNLLLNVVDYVTGVSATFDLGVYFDQVAATPSQSWNLNASSAYASAWSSFIGNSSTANTKWAVIAGTFADFTGPASLLTTFSGTTATLPSGNTNGAIENQLWKVDDFTNAFNALGTNLNSDFTYHGSAFTTQSGPAFVGGLYTSAGQLSDYGVSAMGSLGSGLRFATFQQGATNPFVASNFNMQFTLGSNGILTLAAVPELDTWAMLLSGLAMVGLIARRKTSPLS